MIRMMGMPVLEALPSSGAPYDLVDPFILVHEGRFNLSEMAGKDTKHPHRGFDNLWYLLKGTASTGHSTGPGGSMERARLTEGSLLALRTGRGAWHAEGVGEDEVKKGLGDTEFRGVLFWVNLARKDKKVEPSALVVQPEEIPVRKEGDAIVRVLVGEGSPVQLGTPALILDIELPEGGQVTTKVPAEFQGVAYVLEGEGAFGANGRRAKPPQLVLLGGGEEFTVTDANPWTRYLLMSGKPYGEVPVFVLALSAFTHVNAYLAAFSAGITVATMSPAIRDAFHRFGELVAELLKLAALLVFGALTSLRFLGEIPATGDVFAAFALFGARPLSVTLALIGSKLRVRERITAAWFGPKGFASVVYGLLILHSDVAAPKELFHLVALVVVASIVAHSSTDVVVARWFAPNLTETKPPELHIDGPSAT